MQAIYDILQNPIINMVVSALVAIAIGKLFDPLGGRKGDSHADRDGIRLSQTNILIRQHAATRSAHHDREAHQTAMLVSFIAVAGLSYVLVRYGPSTVAVVQLITVTTIISGILLLWR